MMCKMTIQRSFLKDLFFPPVCVFCQQPIDEYHSLCPYCWCSLNFLNRHCCRYCGVPLEQNPDARFFACCQTCARFSPYQENLKIRAPLIYDEAIKPWILAFKYRGALELAPLFAKFFDKQDFQMGDFIVPVPSHPLKLFRRTYNQTSLLARALKKLYDAEVPPIAFNILKKKHYTQNQRGKNALQRYTNIHGSFAVTEKKVKDIQDKTLIVLDDVSASGSTLMECKKVLKEAGAKRVSCIALAQVPVSSF